jgi:hypothetical protein
MVDLSSMAEIIMGDLGCVCVCVLWGHATRSSLGGGGLLLHRQLVAQAYQGHRCSNRVGFMI